MSGGLRCSIPGIDKLGGHFDYSALFVYLVIETTYRTRVPISDRHGVVSSRLGTENGFELREFERESGPGRRAHLALNENPRVGAT